jgi:hypothetical protein
MPKYTRFADTQGKTRGAVDRNGKSVGLDVGLGVLVVMAVFIPSIGASSDEGAKNSGWTLAEPAGAFSLRKKIAMNVGTHDGYMNPG